eukprot:scaffold124854_cov72-Phaeocystis_antarctica.AAC.1
MRSEPTLDRDAGTRAVCFTGTSLGFRYLGEKRSTHLTPHTSNLRRHKRNVVFAVPVSHVVIPAARHQDS